MSLDVKEISVGLLWSIVAFIALGLIVDHLSAQAWVVCISFCMQTQIAMLQEQGGQHGHLLVTDAATMEVLTRITCTIQPEIYEDLRENAKDIY